jgi:hypothetical protein
LSALKDDMIREERVEDGGRFGCRRQEQRRGGG